ncbi:hypothetical protein ACLMJK_003616 [Lecanora helva]
MVERPTTPPVIQGPNAKEKKYDRQLRLWAASGQQALEEAKVLLLSSGSGVVGVEALKNLILPGVGSFTVVDNAIVSERDLGVNFFLEESSLGRSRAGETCRFLQELNPDVDGTGISLSIEEFVKDLRVLEQYSLILLLGPPKDAIVVHDICLHAERRSIPLFYIHCVGFYSHFSIQLPAQFPIVDTHPDPASTQDLRLLNTWDELESLSKSTTKGLESLSDHDHGHVPYLNLLLHYLDIWKSTHDGQPPANYPQKKEFKALVESGARRNNPEGGEENYDEAAAAVLKSLNPYSISSGIGEVFDSPHCQNLTSKSANFWIIANALRKFHEENGVLPLPGNLPDMKAQSSDYINLQKVYRTKAKHDLTDVAKHVKTLEQRHSITPEIPFQEIEAFCKNAQFVKLIHGRPIHIPRATEDIDWSDRIKPLSQEASDPTSLLPIYFAFLALDRHRDDLARIQRLRSDSNNPLKDIPGGHRAPSGAVLPPPDFVETAHFYTPKSNGGGEKAVVFNPPHAQEMFDDVIKELDRAGGGEAVLHNVAALTGGMVAQEAIKVLTRQYVPVDNTCVFDGVQSKSAVFNI